jgi:hypothetical protein
MEYAHRRVIAWVAAACVAPAAGTSMAATWNVCLDSCSLKTIQSAVDVAASGDQINVYPGRYVGNVTIAGKELSVSGVNRATSQVELIGDGNGPVFTLGADNGGPYYGVFISYLTVTGGSHFGGTGQGGGIQVRQGAYLILMNANVSGNTAAAGGGISVNTQGGPTSEIQSNCLVSSNTAYIGGGVYIAANSSVNMADQCVVANNTASGNAGSNTGGLGGGIYAERGSQLTLLQTTVSNNSATAPNTCNTSQSCAAAGGGVYALGQINISGADITQNNVYNPFGSAQGGGLYVAVSPAQQIGGVVVSHNYVYSGESPATGGGIFAFSSDPTVSWTLDASFILFNNATDNDPSAPPSAGGVQNVGKLTLSNGTTITGNFPSQCLGGKGCPPN